MQRARLLFYLIWSYLKDDKESSWCADLDSISEQLNLYPLFVHLPLNFLKQLGVTSFAGLWFTRRFRLTEEEVLL